MRRPLQPSRAPMMAPASGSSPFGPGQVGSRLVAKNRAPRRSAWKAVLSLSKSKAKSLLATTTSISSGFSLMRKWGGVAQPAHRGDRLGGAGDQTVAEADRSVEIDEQAGKPAGRWRHGRM